MLSAFVHAPSICSSNTLSHCVSPKLNLSRSSMAVSSIRIAVVGDVVKYPLPTVVTVPIFLTQLSLNMFSNFGTIPITWFWGVFWSMIAGTLNKIRKHLSSCRYFCSILPIFTFVPCWWKRLMHVLIDYIPLPTHVPFDSILGAVGLCGLCSLSYSLTPKCLD